MFQLSKVAVLLSLLAVPFVAAQATEASIANIEAHFEQSHITEDYLREFDPSALLTLNYEGVGEITPGQSLAAAQVGPTPAVTITPAEGETLNGTFTIAMIDVDVVGADLAAGVTRHWLVNGATLQNNVVSLEGATVITPYGGPGPAAGSGAHRYIVALYEQPAEFAAPEGFTGPLPIAAMDWLAYVEASNLGDLVAANYINVEEGTYTGTAIPTSPVVAPTAGAPGASNSAGAPRPSSNPSGSSVVDTPRPTSGASKLAVPAAALLGAAAFLAL
ncbi:PEBP-like protein [Coprinopsis marcescibilis]|uniref:PEBP-like protein n=1 Tax=Coprinopsis marcescibilis TaxID=230819 RepID=A0A5C3L0C8_COPMA|nr:PEBP-like protein [Coprinopsis marcescibilis]